MTKKGFTLVELLIVIVIIGILLALSVFGIQNSFERTRDTRRKSDLKQFQNALEGYANKNNGLYPERSSGSTTPTLCSQLGAGSCPADPKVGQSYWYQSDGGDSWLPYATRYILWATLEDPSSPTTYWIVCSNGKSGTLTSGIPPSAGTCPLP